MKIILTGGAGFIGTNLLSALLTSDHEITVIDNFSSGFEKNIEYMRSNFRKSFNFKLRDLKDLNVIDDFKGTDCIVHLAALGSAPRSTQYPQNTFEANVLGTHNVLMAMMRHKIPKIIFASSSSVFTNLHPYALSKNIGEEYLKMYSRFYDFNYMCFRFFNVYGPFQNCNSEYSAVIPKWILKLLKKEQCEIYGNGKTSRDWTYVGDVVGCLINAIENKNPKAERQTYNLGFGESITLKQIHDQINKLLGLKLDPIYCTKRPNDPDTSLSDNASMINLLEYKPCFNWKTGLKETVRWYCDHPEYF